MEIIIEIAAELTVEITVEITTEVIAEAAGGLKYHLQIQLVVPVIQAQQGLKETS